MRVPRRPPAGQRMHFTSDSSDAAQRAAFSRSDSLALAECPSLGRSGSEPRGRPLWVRSKM